MEERLKAGMKMVSKLMMSMGKMTMVRKMPKRRKKKTTMKKRKRLWMKRKKKKRKKKKKELEVKQKDMAMKKSIELFQDIMHTIPY